MALSKSLMYWEEEGVNCYEQSYDSPILDTTESLITRAIEHLDTNLGKGETFHVVDYGTADGSFFLKNIPLVTDKIWKKIGKETEVMVYLDDIPLNDFKSVWRNVDTLRNGNGVYFATSAVSFYDRCFPRNSIHLGVTTAATQWLSDSNFIPHQSFTPNSSTDQDSLKSAMELSENDWEQFLLHRSEELVKGGVLLCLNFAMETEVDKSLWMEAEFKPLDEALRQVYEKGYIDQEEYDNSGVPFFLRTEDQHKKPFLNSDSKVSKSGLKLLHFESKSCTFFEAYKKEMMGKISPENEEEVLEYIAQKRCDLMKLLYSTHFYKALKPNRKEQEKQKIVNLVLESFKENIKQNRLWLTFPNDVHYHFMIIKKDGVITI